MKKTKWHSKKEKPDSDKPVVILLYKRRRWIVGYGYFGEYDYTHSDGEVTHYEYVEEYDCKHWWEDVRKWCYEDEFTELIRKTF